MKRLTLLLLLIPLLAACQHPGQGRYGFRDVGRATAVEFGTVLAARPVEITGQNHGVGAAAGAAGGAIAGAQIGGGDGSLAGALAVALIAGIAGHMAEQAIADHHGVEYTVTLESGRTVTVAQNRAEGDPEIRRGDRVMVQTSGEYMRVLPAAHLPEEIDQPRGVKVKKAKKASQPRSTKEGI